MQNVMVITICLHKALSNGILSKANLRNDNCGTACSRSGRVAVHRDVRVCFVNLQVNVQEDSTNLFCRHCGIMQHTQKKLQRVLLEMQYETLR